MMNTLAHRLVTCGMWASFYLLLAGSALAAEDGEFKKRCRECHDDVIKKWDLSEVLHPPYQKQKCEACHAQEHKQFNAEKGKPCMICHDLTSEKIKSAHFSADLTSADCFMCHYTHGAPREAMLKETIHSPFEKRTCGVCHEVTAEGKIKRKEKIQKICTACHSNRVPKADDNVHPGFEMQECPDCHSPHTTTRERLLRKDVSDLCFECHDEQEAAKHPYDAAASQKIAAGDPHAMRLSMDRKVLCTSCHNPHFSRLPFLLVEPLADGKLCYTCHRRRSER